MSAVLDTSCYKPTRRYTSLSNFDMVLCLRCLIWPPLASDWPTRCRNHAWPDAATIHIVVSNGCDVVKAVHRLCKQDRLMNEYQWRLSFSRAEVTLLNSWTPVQQIVYHMLRFIVKHKLHKDLDSVKTNFNNPDVPKLSNYHIKTLMLWGCEQKPHSWWSAESSLVKLCSTLLHKLSDWVTDRRCQHYFISDCNILDHFLDDASTLTIRNTLLADESVLLRWFVKNYIRKCAERCPSDVSILFQDISSSDKLEKAVQVLVDWKQNSMPKELYEEHHKSEARIQSLVMCWRRDAAGILMYMKDLQNCDMQLRDYFVSLTSLRVAFTIPTKPLMEELLEVLWTLFDPCSAEVGPFDTGAGSLYIRKAIKLARLNNGCSNALEMLYDEMSKAYLHHSLESGHEATHCAHVAHLLLAALCYKSGHCQAAVYHCEEVLNREHHGSRNVGAEFLPPIDDNADSVFGLVHLYEHVQRHALNNRQESNKLESNFGASITPKLLADYLYSQCSKKAKKFCDKLTKYRQHLFETKQLLLCDVLLFRELDIQQLGKCSGMSDVNAENDNASLVPSPTDTSLLATALELVALEKLISFRQRVVDELHSEQYPVLNEFKALHAYRSGLFEVCFEMCRNHVSMLLHANCIRNQLYVTLVPQLAFLLDDELVSLFGVVQILHPDWFVLGVQFPDYGEISMLTVSLHLMVQCQKKLRKDSTAPDTLQQIRYILDKLYPNDSLHFLDRLILKLTHRSLKLYIDNALFRAE